MMRTCTRSLALAAALIAVAAAAAPGPDMQSRQLSQVMARLARHPVVLAKMHIRQQLKILSAPLTSSGEILVSRKLGVIWKVDSPFRSTLMFPSKGSTKGRDVESRFVSRLISAIVSGRLDRVAAYFRVDSVNLAPDGDFVILLTPANALLSRTFKTLRLSGRDELTSVELDSKNGDTARYRFSGHRYPVANAASLSDYLPLMQ